MLKGSAFIMILSLLGEALGLIMIMIVGNRYSVAEAGLLITLQNNLFLFGTIGSLGLGTGFLRYAPHYWADGRLDVVRGLQRWTYAVALVGLVLMALAHTGFLLWSEETRHIGLALALTGSLGIVFWGLVTLNRQFQRALKQVFWSEFSYQVIRPVGGALILAAGIMWGGGIPTIVLALVLPLLVGFLFDLRRISRKINGLFEAADFSSREDWRTSAPHFAQINLTRVVLQRVDLFVVSALLGLEAAAVYGLASRLATLSTLAVEPIRAMFQPRASLHHRQGQTEALQRDVIQGTLWIGATALAAVVLFLTSAPLWLTLFGDISDGRDSVVLLFVLLVGYFVNANSSVASAILLMTGSEKLLARLNMALNLVLYPPLLWLGIQIWGLYGAALATTAIRVINSAAILWLTWHKTGIWAVAKPTPANLALAFSPIWTKRPKHKNK